MLTTELVLYIQFFNDLTTQTEWTKLVSKFDRFYFYVNNLLGHSADHKNNYMLCIKSARQPAVKLVHCVNSRPHALF
jgi:hypothetical protein